MRMFVAVTPSEQVVEAVEEFWEPRRGAAGFRWTVPDQWHLTLAFLADVPDRSYDDLVDRLGRAARKRRPMTAALVGGGAFPDAARAKVLWAGVEMTPGDAEELRRLATGCRAAATKAGAATDGQRFRPHLTLARMGRPGDVTDWVRLLDTFRTPTWSIEAFALIASHLGEGPRRRPRYEVLETFALGRDAISRG